MKLSSMDRATLENLSENFSTGITAIKETVMTTVFLTDVDDAVFSAAGHEDLYLDIVSQKSEVEELENPEQKEKEASEEQEKKAAAHEDLDLDIVSEKTEVEELENPEQKEKEADLDIVSEKTEVEELENLEQKEQEASEEQEKKAVVLIESSFLPSEAIAKSTGNLASIYLDDNDGKADNCEWAFFPLLFKPKNSLHGGM
jgi:outer membrane biosynthesis protein TonB